MELLQDLVISEIRLPSTVYNRLTTFSPFLWSEKEFDPLTCALNGWEVDAKDTLVCKECSAKYIPSSSHNVRNDPRNAHYEKCSFNIYIEYTFPELDSASVMAGFTKRANGLLNCNLENTVIESKHCTLSICNYSQDIQNLAIFGWEYKSNDSITCYLCNRTVGLWKRIINVESDHRWWCPWVKESVKVGWKITLDKLTHKEAKQVIHLDDPSQVVDWMNTIMPTNKYRNF